jgi:cell division protein FtsL
LFSALAVVYSENTNRYLYAEINQEKNNHVILENENKDLQINQALMSTSSDIKTSAERKLNMNLPQPNDILTFYPR